MSNTFRAAGLVVTEHEFRVPLDHDRPDGERITVFARGIAHPDGLGRPFLIFLQSGPGSEAPRPTAPASGWVGRALKEYRVLMLDQRGAGRSSPIGSLRGMSPQQQADYLTHFRADSIVRDAEAIRREMGVDRWSVLGQSFGGFCTMTYLSVSPDGLREAFITGGLAPIGRQTDDVYRKTYARVLERNRRYYERYPADRQRVHEIHERLQDSDVRLPSGDRLTSRRFRQLGAMLGMSTGAEELHYLVGRPIDSPGFLYDMESFTAFGRNPLYAIIHEACYADGCVTGWSAERLIPTEYEAPELFTGEHVYPWMFEEYGMLVPLREAAEILAQHEWPSLYDEVVLSRNDVPAAAAVYLEDMYVEYEFSSETAKSIRGLRPWITNEYEHNALRADGERVLGRLIDMVKGRV